MIRKTFIAAAVAAASLVGVATTAQAVPAIVATGPGYMVQAAPPPPLYEAVPSARAGYIWTPGYYEWRGDRYVWTGGRWQETRQGYAWQQPRWQQRVDGSWYLMGGQWVRSDNVAIYDDRDDRRWRRLRGPDGDLDGDGIANRDDRDLDGDGYRNRDDDFPRDPNRH